MLFSAIFFVLFNYATLTNPKAAESRFNALAVLQAPGRAAPHGERALAMYRADGVDEETLAPLKAKLAKVQLRLNKFARSASLFEQALASQWGSNLQRPDRIQLEDKLARTHIAAGDLEKAISIYAIHLDYSGDEGARSSNKEQGTIQALYAERIEAAGDLFSEALKPTGSPEQFEGAPQVRLAAAQKMDELGAFYAMRSSGVYAAAGLLSSSYQIRRQLLGGDHQDTVRIALILGPIYTQMGRLKDAERLYLEAFHAQEKVKGANSPDLSLYIKLLVGVYQQQGRTTEAQALYDHMQSLFRDAFGAQRYAVNRQRDRRRDVDRPVSQFFLLESTYKPKDLVRASDYSIPVSKDHNLDEMKVRLASDQDGSDPLEANLPARLAQLISLCRSDSGERISLRSGYRSYKTQQMLFKLNGAKGKTAPPGMSEHQLGLAVDIDVNGRLMRRSDRTYQCFEENAYQYGFILSFPPDNNYLPSASDPFEPWHWRYVGVDTAQLYREAGPLNKPQEFLAALPCYREQAASGAYRALDQADMCLQADNTPSLTMKALEEQKKL